MPNTREKLIGRLPVDDAILILREELKQRTDGYATHLSYGGKGDPAEEVSIDALEMAIEALEKQKWIPVTERLPEESDDYLAYCGEYDGICVLYYEILETKGKWRSKWKEVAHWMPLPTPPKEG